MPALSLLSARPTNAPRDDGGAFLNLAPNGINVLRTLGLEHIIDGLGFQNDRLVFHNEAGRVLADAPVGGVTIMRGALSRALRAAAERAGVRFEFGKALASIDERNGGVVARFADGTTKQGRVLIGADGIHSRYQAQPLRGRTETDLHRHHQSRRCRAVRISRRRARRCT